jgi:hypothetical protein
MLSNERPVFNQCKANQLDVLDVRGISLFVTQRESSVAIEQKITDTDDIGG